jgi:hypothetical protein
VALGGIRPQRIPQLAHHRRSAHVVPLDVADDQADPVIGQLQQVVPVAADSHAVGGRHVVRGRRDAGRLRQCARQQVRLELGGERALGFAQPGAGERLGDQTSHADDERALLRAEVVARVVADGQGADRLTGDDQRQERPRLLLRLVDQRTQLGVAVEVGRARGQEQRPPLPHDLDDRRPAVEVQAGERGHGIRGVADVTGQPQPSALDHRDQQAGGAEGGQHRIRDGLDDVGDRVCLGQRSRVVDDLGDLLGQVGLPGDQCEARRPVQRRDGAHPPPRGATLVVRAERGRPTGRQDVVEEVLVALFRQPRPYLEQRPADDVGADTEHPAGSCVGVRHAPVGVDGQHRVGKVLERRKRLRHGTPFDSRPPRFDEVQNGSLTR